MKKELKEIRKKGIPIKKVFSKKEKEQCADDLRDYIDHLNSKLREAQEIGLKVNFEFNGCSTSSLGNQPYNVKVNIREEISY